MEFWPFHPMKWNLLLYLPSFFITLNPTTEFAGILRGERPAEGSLEDPRSSRAWNGHKCMALITLKLLKVVWKKITKSDSRFIYVSNVSRGGILWYTCGCHIFKERYCQQHHGPAEIGWHRPLRGSRPICIACVALGPGVPHTRFQVVAWWAVKFHNMVMSYFRHDRIFTVVNVVRKNQEAFVPNFCTLLFM